MRCTVCADSDSEWDDQFGGPLCDVCSEQIETYEDGEREELLVGLRAAFGVKAPAVLPPHIEYFPERKDGPIDL